MTSPLADMPRPGSPGAASGTRPVAAHPMLSAGLAKRVLIAAVLLGVTGDALLHDGPLGLAFPIWIALLGLELKMLAWRGERPLHRESAAWLVSSVVCAAALAWRNAEMLRGLDLLATAGCLGLAAVSLHDPDGGLLSRRLRDSFVTARRQLFEIAKGPLLLLFRDARFGVESGRLARRSRPFVTAGLIGLFVVVVFGSLLRSADPIFASIVSLPSFDVDTLMEHVVLTGFFAWIVSGWARGALLDDAPPRASSTFPLRLTRLDVTVGLGALAFLLAAFIATQLGWFFGGAAFLRARTGLTVSAYARRGFFELVWVTTLAIPLILATRAALPANDHAVRRRHSALSGWIIALLVAVSASAVLRLKLYVTFYGLTVERIYPLAFIAWLVFLLFWTAATVLRDRGGRFVAGTLVSALTTLLALNIADPDAIVARTNLARASRAGTPSDAQLQPLDVAHLATLAGGAVPSAVTSVIGASNATVTPDEKLQRCTAARTLLLRWGPDSRVRRDHEAIGAWRSWNHDDAIALEAVEPRSAELRAIVAANCASAPPAAQR
jgi:uncharacterized protein DUF4153